jgi:methyl-accepting chemotaxis protein
MSIKNSLGLVIKSINDFSKRTNMVAINAAIHASKLDIHQGAPFQVLVKEIQTMSSQSIDKLGELDGLVNEIAALSNLINKTGSQRMLLMKTVNACMLEDQNSIEDCCQKFDNQMNEIKASQINTSESFAIIDQVDVKWQSFKTQLNHTTPMANYQRANEAITVINELIEIYEQHAGD